MRPTKSSRNTKLSPTEDTSPLLPLETMLTVRRGTVASLASLDLPHCVDAATMASWHSVMMDPAGRLRMKSLFWETRKFGEEARIPPLFTNKAKAYTVDGKTYPSLKEIYFTYDHIPGYEYDFAMEVFGSWEYWVRLTNSSICDMFRGWREELAIKLKARAVHKLMTASLEASAVGVNAAKYLADEGYIPKKIGRVSKEEREKQARIASGVADTLSEDMERLGLKVVNGNK